jgi:hypothetical protein
MCGAAEVEQTMFSWQLLLRTSIVLVPATCAQPPCSPYPPAAASNSTQLPSHLRLRCCQVFTLTGVSCWRCGKRGHLTKDCSQPDARPCVFCARYGHDGVDCPDSE